MSTKPVSSRLTTLWLGVAVVAGTWAGSRLLDRVSEAAFVRLYQTVLTLTALRLLLWEGLAVLGLR